MAHVAIVFWSGTGNTEAMADSVAQGVREAGGTVNLIQAGDFSPADVESYDAFAFGCPAMGNEILEEDEFEPMYDAVEPALAGKNVVLFGSYDWGTGEWMESWEQRATDAGLNVLDSVIANLDPDGEAQAACVALGKTIATA